MRGFAQLNRHARGIWRGGVALAAASVLALSACGSSSSTKTTNQTAATGPAGCKFARRGGDDQHRRRPRHRHGARQRRGAHAVPAFVGGQRQAHLHRRQRVHEGVARYRASFRRHPGDHGQWRSGIVARHREERRREPLRDLWRLSRLRVLGRQRAGDGERPRHHQLRGDMERISRGHGRGQSGHRHHHPRRLRGILTYRP